MANFSKDAATGNLLIEDAQLLWRNFSGVEQTYNKKGDRNVKVIVPDEFIDQMKADGWNVQKKIIQYIDPERPIGVLKLNLNYRNNPDGTPDSRNPKFWVIANGHKTLRLEKDLGYGDTKCIYDTCKIKNCDVEVHPYHWDKNTPNSNKVSGYIQNIWMEIEISSMDAKYSNYDESSSSSPVEEEDLPF